MESRHVKSISVDKRSNKRLRFASAKERSQRASADVYRSHKRKIGATSSSTREEAVHNPRQEFNARKRQRSHHRAIDDDKGKTAVLQISEDDDEFVPKAELEDVEKVDISSSLAEELDETLDRNASEIFSKFHRQLWPLVRSLPEILHHSEKIVDSMLSHMLSSESDPERPSDFGRSEDISTSNFARAFIVNHATLDVLHLMSVLARDLRHELHPFLDKILRRIIQDLLNPPPPPPDSGKQPIPLDVSMVEAAYRCISYILRYDADMILGDMENMRKYYGTTLAARRDLCRRLAAETFAPLIRKMKSQKERQRHLKRVLKALVAGVEGQPLTAQLKRTQHDAIDGIATLLFEVVRGVPGRLHSQGSPTVQFIISYCTQSTVKEKEDKDLSSNNVLLLIASSFLTRLCGHVDEKRLGEVIGMMSAVMGLSLSQHAVSESGCDSALNTLRLLSDVMQSDRISRQMSKIEDSVDLCSSLHGLFADHFFQSLPSRKQEEVVSLLCPILLSLQNDHRIQKRLGAWLDIIMNVGKKNASKDRISAISACAEILARTFIPYLSNRECMDQVGRATLSAAAEIAHTASDSAILTVFALASKRLHEDRTSASDDSKFTSIGDLFQGEGTLAFRVSAIVYQVLLETCLVNFDSKTCGESDLEKLAIAIRCVPFVAMLSVDGSTKKQRCKSFQQTLRWLVKIISTFGKLSLEKEKVEQKQSLVLITALALEGFSHVVHGFLDFDEDSEIVSSSVNDAKETVVSLLFANTNSMWAMRGVAAYVGLLSRLHMKLNDKCDETFGALIMNLSSPSHALRHYTLQILAAYPMKIFTTDHADLDIEGDLDEDPSFRPENGGYVSRAGPVGQCDIISTLLRIEDTRVRLVEERSLLSLVSRIEVLGRSGRLPVVYVEAATHHMLGLFYVKFAPLWPLAERALVALIKGQENIAWPALEARLVKVIEARSKPSDYQSDEAEVGLIDYTRHFLTLKQWEESQGRCILAFGPASSIQDGEVSRHLTTDENTVMESVWGVAEKCQHQVAKHSRVIVPCFKTFLTDQYFFFHDDDPSARELNLNHPSKECSVDRSLIQKSTLQKQLKCFLNVFAAIDGPQQMVQHQLLEQVFRSFLTHQETSIVKLALMCLMKYKSRHLLPYRSFVSSLLERGKLRDAILKFEECIEAGKVEAEHRHLLVPIVSRILFGRLSVRESRSTKDSPASKRAAVLSFVSVMCHEDAEMFSFLYLMTRSFIPRDQNIKEVEAYSSVDWAQIRSILSAVRAEDIQLPSGVIEGFLHLLQAVVAQLGHRIQDYIPMLTSLVIATCHSVAVVERPSVTNSEPFEEYDVENFEESRGKPRRGAIRTLCFQRLSEIFVMYAGAIDFENFGPRLWTATGGSIALLPEMVVKAERAPAFLHMIETLSGDISLRKLLCINEAVVGAVIRCISSSSTTPVMNCVLSIIENILQSSSEDANSGFDDVVARHVPLILEQFTNRFKGEDALEELSLRTGVSKGFKKTSRQVTWRKELQILCRVSELLGDENYFKVGDRGRILEDLGELLLPFLRPGQGTSDEDKLNVLGILKGMASLLPEGTLMTVYRSLSEILGPTKGKQGIESIPVRKEIAEVLTAVGDSHIEFRKIALKVANMNASNSKRVDEVDFEIVIPELNALGRGGKGCEWENLGGKAPLNLVPIIGTCFHFLHNEDGVLARASFNALKTLILLASEESKSCPYWIKVVESLVVPCARSGLQARSVPIRRFYVLIIREIAVCFRHDKSPNLCGDLNALVDEENLDLDFFVSVTHVQLHRRGRAFHRLRKSLKEDASMARDLTSQSLSSVLLPLALHPVYECKTKAEEGFALEGIATVGAIARYLPWNKYQSTIGSILSSFERHPEQERYLIATLCAVIDSFSFELVSAGEDHVHDTKSSSSHHGKTAVWRALEKRFIPRLEGLLTKEKTERNGSKTKVIRPPIILALVKLFQKFPVEFFESKLPHILTVLCDALRNKASDARDLARTTMAKIVIGMDYKYLKDVVRELAITLNEGYKLHVRAATIHTILNELLTVHNSSDLKLEQSDAISSGFDQSIPAIMDIMQEDLFGEANERRESQDTNVRYVKEAGGSKSVHSIEMICRMLQFKPTDASKGSVAKSSVHCVVGPLLERLRLPDTSTATIRKIKEILIRVVIGLSHNPSIEPEELFPFVYATIQPFIGAQTIAAVLDDDDDNGQDDRLKVSGARDTVKANTQVKAGKVVEWRPSSLKHAQSYQAAIDLQRHERQELRRVRDGASAPKLTGTGRHGSLDVSDTHGLNDPASVSAVIFGLNLLNSCLKKMTVKPDDKKLMSMMDPFVAMLTTCICNCKDNDVALLAMKCIMSLLRYELPSFSKCSKALGPKALMFLSSSGSSLNQNDDMKQACFRTLTYLINRDQSSDSMTSNRPIISGAEGEERLSGIKTMPLNGEQMKVLISFLSITIAESNQHNPALSLIKAILSRKFTSPEFYDLMESMLKVNVRSQKASLRQQSAGLFIRYLLDYPMGEERFEQHLKQIVANIGYEYNEGRLSAIELLTLVVEKLPDALLERHAQLLFLPQVLQLVNDDSKDCREAVAKCLSKLLGRASTEVLQSFHNYTVRWCSGQGPMQVASLQVFGIMVESCPGFLQSNKYVPSWMERFTSLLQTSQSADEWEVPYFSLICVEKLAGTNQANDGDPHDDEKEPQSIIFSVQYAELWNSIVERLIDAHPWIKLASCRLVSKLMASSSGSETTVPLILEQTPGALFEILRNLCFQLNVEEDEQNEDLTTMVIKAVTLALPVAHARPDLCFAADSPHSGLRDPIAWVLRRLSGIAKVKGRQRRMAVYKCFAALCSRHADIVLTGSTNMSENNQETSSKISRQQQYLEFIVEPLHRSDLEANNELENPNVLFKMTGISNLPSNGQETVVTESTLARDVLQLVEEACQQVELGAEAFVQALAAVKRRARDKKDQRKVQAKAESVHDPATAALKKTKKHGREKDRKKRRVEERRRDRGASKKQRHGA